MLHVYYRLTAETESAVRPPYFSKHGALANFLTALRRVPGTELSVIYDESDQGDAALSLIPAGVHVHRVHGIGNSGSLRYAYDLSLELPPNDLAYFVEDDYLHTADSIAKLSGAAAILTADYFTLYDHPVRYATDYRFGLDLPTRHQKILLAADHHWRAQESTCMTFAAHVAVLRADRAIFWRYTASDVPEDRELFRRLQGLVAYEDQSPFRVLLGPIPSLATHCHQPWLAPTLDWQRIFEETVAER